jgi:hypothetical protein
MVAAELPLILEVQTPDYWQDIRADVHRTTDAWRNTTRAQRRPTERRYPAGAPTTTNRDNCRRGATPLGTCSSAFDPLPV